MLGCSVILVAEVAAPGSISFALPVRLPLDRRPGSWHLAIWCFLYSCKVSNEKGRGTHSRGGQRKIGTPEHELEIVCGKGKMAQSKDPRLEKLLLQELKPKEISQVGLVYFAAINTVVCQEKTT